MSKTSSPKSTPQAGSITNPPNLVGKRFTVDEFNGRFIIQATIQKIANLPSILNSDNFVNSKDKLEFRLTLTANTSGDGIASSICNTPQVVATFTPDMIRKARGSGQYEVTFDNNNSNATNGGNANSQNWVIQAEGRNQLAGKCSMRIQLQEYINGAPYRVLFDSTTPVSLQKVLDRKVLVSLYGCPIGRIGVTLSVSAEDQVGYKKRMDRFLAQFSASPDPQIASSIMSKCDEITTFAYLWKRYGIVDYSARLRRFLNLYSRHLVGQEETLLTKYKMHEEEMFMNLVLDNGPEELDIDAKKRLESFKSRYFMTSLDVERESQRSFGDFLSFMDRLVETNGPEPDPRTYLFPDPNYKPPPGVVSTPTPSSSQQQQQQQDLNNNNTPVSKNLNPTSNSPLKSFGNNNNNSETNVPTPQSIQSGAHLRSTSSSNNNNTQNQNNSASSPPQLSNTTTANSSSKNDHQHPSSSSTQQQSNSNQNNNNNASPISQLQQQRPPVKSLNANNFTSNSATSLPQHQHQQQTPSTSSSSQEDLWGNFLASLTAKRVSASDIFFLSDDAFLSLMAQVGVQQNHRHLVMSEWKRRATENLQLTHFAPAEPSFDSIRTELLALTEMQPINLSVLGVVGLRNIEHEATHATRLTLMNEKNRNIERCVYAGEYNTLLRCAERGITAIMNPTDSGLCFPRRPFSQFEKPTAVSVMICDVITGYQTNAPTVKEAALARSDTVAVGSGNAVATAGAAVDEPGLFVRDVRHVLPRFIVHCHVDPTLVACPLHPNKQVEYYVVDLQTFACSNCVVLGPHVGKPIVTLDEALQWARTQLNDILKDADQCTSTTSELDRDMTEQLDSITGENAKKRKQELIESIRREAELRAQDAAQQLEAEMAMQADVIKSQLQRIAPLKSSLNQTSKVLQNTVRQGNVAKALDVLQNVSHSYDGNDYRQKVNEVKQTLSMMPQLSHNGSKAPWAFASAQSIGRQHNNNNIQHQHQQHNGSRSGSQNNSAINNNNDNGGFSRFMDAANTVALNRANSSSLPNNNNNNRRSSLDPNNNNNNNSLYNKFVNASSSSQPNSQMPSPGGQSSASTRLDNHQHHHQQGRELLQDGWKAFRRGDTTTARSLWSTANDRYPNTAIGSRAMAYISEAIDKDAVKASECYERALQCDPTDCMTLFNYGVLLEATGHTLRALQLFESAQRLGDIASGKRARAIRQQQLASNDH